MPSFTKRYIVLTERFDIAPFLEKLYCGSTACRESLMAWALQPWGLVRGALMEHKLTPSFARVLALLRSHLLNSPIG